MKLKYKQIRVNGKRIDLHRHLMELKLGRKLNSDEVVHHINEDIHDNRIENLELMSFSNHSSLHKRNVESHRYQYKLRKLTNEQAKQLRAMACEGNISTMAIAKHFGIGHTTVRHIVAKECYSDVI